MSLANSSLNLLSPFLSRTSCLIPKNKLGPLEVPDIGNKGP